MEPRKKEEWHLNKGVPISLIFAIFVQTVGIVWWAASMDARVAALEGLAIQTQADLNSENLRQWARINSTEDSVEAVRSSTRVITAVMSRLEARVDSLADEIRETNRILREQYERPN
tara:strand:- start:1433 stop:1783 length:351 start_codon:yes stop_codon:yes gene_type:complete